MSERACNRCRLDAIYERAELAGETVTIVEVPLDGFPDEKEVYKHPLFIIDLAIHGDRYLEGWFACIPEQCEC